MLFIVEHKTSIIGNMKSIIGKNFGKFPKAFGPTFEHICLRPNWVRSRSYSDCYPDQ